MRRSTLFSFLLLSVAGASLVFGQSLLRNGGFEDGFSAPWGVGQYGGQGIWWNSGGCQSAAGVDSRTAHQGRNSLHIVNATSRAPNVYGTTVQEIAIQPGQMYRVSLWAMARDLASAGAVFIIVDQGWNVRPIALPAGTYGWRRFEGTFQLPSAVAEIRILTEDKGEAWLDEISVVPMSERTRPPDDINIGPVSGPASGMGIRTISCSPKTVLRGQQARIAVEYAEPASAPVSVVEEWTLLFNDRPVIPPFKRQFEIRRGQSRHEIMLPIPTQADVGIYKMKLHSVSPVRSVDGQVLIEVAATNTKG